MDTIEPEACLVVPPEPTVAGEAAIVMGRVDGTEKTYLGDRMKQYERQWSHRLTPRLPLIIRIDGKSFHSWTNNFIYKPDVNLVRCMMATAFDLVSNIPGARFAYTQSDEISILVTEDKAETQPWFGKKIQKVVSVVASMATAYFAENLKNKHPVLQLSQSRPALFDARAFVLPINEVVDYFCWRQLDAVRNSVQLEAQKWWSPKKLNGLSCRELTRMLIQDKSIVWSDFPHWQKHGACIVRVPTVVETEHGPVTRQRVQEDWLAPNFCKDPEYISKFLQPEEVTCESPSGSSEQASPSQP